MLGSTSLFSSPNLVAYHKLDDLSDSKGTATLTNNNTVTFTAAKFNNGANFSTPNSNKYLSSSDNLGVDGGAFSVSFWVKCLAEIGTGAWCLAAQCNASSDVHHSVYYQYNSGTRRLYFDRVKLNVGEQGPTMNTTLGTANFHHIVYTYDGVNVIGYLDNVASSPGAASGNGSSSAANGIAIGCTVTVNSFSSVLIDDIGWFNKALSVNEVNILYNDIASGGSFLNNFV